MIHNREQRVAELFHQTLEQPTGERTAYLRGNCPGDDGLHDEVASLVSAYERSPRSLEEPIFRVSPAELHEMATRLMVRERDLAGQCVGGFRLLRRIGAGGTGAVWLGERADGRFDQSVAVKLVDPWATRDAERYFANEIEALARLNHPYIARLYDAGWTEDGIPYFVMEYVHGERIDSYCRGHGLSIGQRLDLFRRVCEAGEYAHRNLVVHRDIKPSNILIDAHGNPKLLDFGVAKLMQPTGPRGTGLTVTIGRLFTPEYASPEQIRGESVTTTSDVFSLGAVLYELLTDRRFRDLFGIAQSIETWVDAAPLPPSRAVFSEVSTKGGQHGATPSGSTAPRSNGSCPASRDLAGDLDVIVLTALRREPERRYKSVEQFAEDIRRHQEGLPIAARADTWRYRFGKLVRRRKALMACILATFLGLIGTVVGTSVGLMRATHARRGMEHQAVLARAAEGLAQARLQEVEAARQATEHEAGRHRAAAERAERITAFLKEMLSSVNPLTGQPANATVRQMLDLASMRVPLELGSYPDIHASVCCTLGGAYLSLGLYERAEEQFQTSLRLRRQIFGELHFWVAETLFHLGKLHDARGEWSEAREYFERALALQTTQSGEHELAAAETQLRLAWCFWHLGDLAAARMGLEHALTVLPRHLGDTNPRVTACKVDLASVLVETGDYDRASELLSGTVDAAVHSIEQNPADALRVITQTADMRREFGELASGEALLHEHLRLARHWFGERHPMVATSLREMAKADFAAGRLQTAISRTAEARAIIQENYRDDSVEDLGMLAHEAGFRWAWGDYANAERLFRQCLLVEEQRPGTLPSQRLIGLMGSLGVVLRDQHRLEEARSYLQGSMTLARDSYPQTHRFLANGVNNLARLEYLGGDFIRAEELIRDALDVRTQMLPLGHADIGESMMVLGLILSDTGRGEEGEPLLREALAIREQRYPHRHWLVAEAQCALGASLSRQGRFEDAESNLLECATVSSEVLLPQHIVRREACRRLVDLYSVWGRTQDAEQYGGQLRLAMELLVGTTDPGGADTPR